MIYLEKCYNLADINLHDMESSIFVGGIFGDLREVYLTDCSNYGKLSIIDSESGYFSSFVGGIGGDVTGYSNYTRCHNEGEIDVEKQGGSLNVGGIVRL